MNGAGWTIVEVSCFVKATIGFMLWRGQGLGEEGDSVSGLGWRNIYWPMTNSSAIGFTARMSISGRTAEGAFLSTTRPGAGVTA